jgi:hypothetical protein
VLLTLEEAGMISVAAYGMDDLTIDCTAPHPIKSVMNAIIAAVNNFITNALSEK